MQAREQVKSIFVAFVTGTYFCSVSHVGLCLNRLQAVLFAYFLRRGNRHRMQSELGAGLTAC